MTNPTPRPALRKAEDASVHPAAPRPARSARAAAEKKATSPAAVTELPPPADPGPEPAAPSPATTPPSTLTSSRKRSGTPSSSSKPRKRKFGGATSDHLRPDADGVLAPPPPRAPKKAHKAPTEKPVNLMKGKSAELDVTVPKALRKAAKDRAKSEGLDLDTVVIDLLHDWVTRPPR